jgi:hypothetical protein
MTNPKDSLEKARVALAGGDYAAASELYEYFFDHALETDKSFYGVRLSYCLDEWAEVAKKYPPARVRLEEKMAAALAQFDKTRKPEYFHDYYAICRSLDCVDKAVEKFLAYHNSDSLLAQNIFRFVRGDLVAAKQWDVCGTYLQDSAKVYRKFLEAFDGTMKYGREKDHDETISFAKDWFVENMTDLLLVLKHTGRHEEAEAIQEQMSLELMTRDMPELADDVADKIILPA